MRRAAIYLLVSTIDQTTANQERELRETAQRARYKVVRVYKDHGISGAKAFVYLSDREETTLGAHDPTQLLRPLPGNRSFALSLGQGC